MNFYKKAILGIVIALIVQAIPACTESITDYDREKVRLDSISAVITNTKLALNIDEAELQNRVAIIDTWYPRLNDTNYEVANQMRIDFNGYKSVYKQYIDNFFIYASALDLNDKQFKTLEQKVKDQTIKREEFKNEYSRLKTEVEKNYQNAKTIAKPVFDLELSWRRYEKIMGGMQKQTRPQKK